MKKVIKKTPITFNGVDGFEVLIKDSEVWAGDCCDKCIYSNYVPSSEIGADCCTVHSCGTSPFTYFGFEPFKFINP